MRLMKKKFIVTALMIAIFTLLKVLGITSDTSVYAVAKAENPYLKSIYLSEDCQIDFEKDKYIYMANVDTDVDEIILKAKPEKPDYVVKINNQELKSDEKYKYIGKLDIGKNTFDIKVFDKVNKSATHYKIYVYRGNDKAVYLKNLTLDDNNIGFASTIRNYNIELDEGTKEVVLEAFTQGDNDTVYVQDVRLNFNNTIKLKFTEKAGKYTFKVKVQDNENYRTGEYTINIYLGIPVSPNVTDSLNRILKPNKWCIVNGRWQFNDSLGRPIKNNWFFDCQYDGYFHFNSRGNMQTGWNDIDGKTYYLGTNGKMYIGWIKYYDEWYYLDYNGVMQTGWSRIDDKWYYFDKFGVMQTGWIKLDNTWYFIGADGHMKTGWILYDKKWYYLDYNGKMRTGWIYYNNEWYYLDNDGHMKCGEWLYYNYNWYYINCSGTMRCGWLYKNNKYYYMDKSGKMVTGKMIIDNYLYTFNKDGAAII